MPSRAMAYYVWNNKLLKSVVADMLKKFIISSTDNSSSNDQDYKGTYTIYNMCMAWLKRLEPRTQYAFIKLKHALFNYL